MYCYQCQETVKNQGCTIKGVCGKPGPTADLQDLLIFLCKGISVLIETSKSEGQKIDKKYIHFITDSLFTTITNANFHDEKITQLIKKGLTLRDELKASVQDKPEILSSDVVSWSPADDSALLEKSQEVGVLNTEDEDVRSLRELLTYGLKGIAAYAHHARILGFEDEKIDSFMTEALASTLKELSVDEMVALVLKAGETAVTTMALLDKANTTAYGNPEISKVNIGVRNNPGILISGHDLKDMEELLKQTEGTGVDVYTHSEMLPANYYPAFKKYDHFVGNYGNSWWKQSEEFTSFNGPILMTTNCITPVKDAYKERIFTTGTAGYPEVKHIESNNDDPKDFSEIIALAKTCDRLKR